MFSDKKEYIEAEVRSDSKTIVHRTRQYYKCKEEESLLEKINNKEYWEDPEDSELLIGDQNINYEEDSFLSGHSYGEGDKDISFLELIQKEDDEIVFSNLFANLLRFEKKSFESFISEVLGIETANGIDSFLVRREYENVDLWLEINIDGVLKHIIIIENKVKSGINRITQAGNTKTDEGSPDGLLKESQLAKYIDKAIETRNKMIEEAKFSCSGPELHFFLFVPNYKVGSVLPYTKETWKDYSYRLIKYSELLDFFRKNCDPYVSYLGSSIYSGFLKGLHRHSFESIPQLNKYIMTKKFKAKFKQMKNRGCL